MLGAIIGDIAGSRFEFTFPGRTDFEFFTTDDDFTDDSICTVAIADAILNGRSYKESLLSWCRKYPDPKGYYGGSFARWIHSDDPQPYGSCGNGSAMRVSAVGWLFNSLEDVQHQAKLSAEMTHNHPEGIKGAQCIATLIFLLRTKAIQRTDIKDFVETQFGYSIPTLQELYQAQIMSEICQETVPQAISCFLESNSFEECVRLAVSIGGDTDTTACIAGSIAEAYFPVPEALRTAAMGYLPSDLRQIVNQFYQHIAER